MQPNPRCLIQASLLIGALTALGGCGNGGSNSSGVVAGDRLVFALEAQAGATVVAKATANVAGVSAIAFTSMRFPAGTRLAPSFAAESDLISEPLTEAQASAVRSLTASSTVTLSLSLQSFDGKLVQDADHNVNVRFATWKPSSTGAQVTTTNQIEAQLKVNVP